MMDTGPGQLPAYMLYGPAPDQGGMFRMLISEYFILFILFSILGWLYECIFCTVKNHHWENRGFLYGPLCPIYGTGVVGALILFRDLPAALFEGGTELSIPVLFLGSLAGSAVLEFGTSWILEKCFHAVWWDYSNVPLNIQGRICLPASCCFGIAGVVLVRVVFPLIDRVPAPDLPLLTEGIALVLAVCLGADLALTVESLTRLTRRLDEAQAHFDARAERGVQTIRQGPAAVGSAVKASARDAGETAAIAAMLAADAAKEKLGTAKEKADASARSRLPRSEERELPEHLRTLPDSLSGLDRYHIRSIRAYRPRRRSSPDTAEKLRRFFDDLQKKSEASRKPKSGRGKKS